MFNGDVQRLLKRFSRKTILYQSQKNIQQLIRNTVYFEKEINPDAMTDEEYDKFYADIASEDYKETKKHIREMDADIKAFAKKYGFKVVHKKDIAENPENYRGMYGISIKDLLEGKEPDNF